MRHPQKPDLELDGFKYWHEEDQDDDVIKIWHTVETPEGRTEHLDYSPYSHMNNDVFTKFVAFHKAHDRFPTRKDTHSIGPLRDEDLDHLVDSLQEADQTLLPRKTGDATARRMAEQLVRTAIKNFHADDELKAAKKMARGFYNNLMKHVDEVYHELTMKKVEPVKEQDFKLSLTEVVAAADEEDWQYDHAEDTGMSAICPKCGSHEVMTDTPPGHKIHAHRLECQECGNFSKWSGPDSHIAQRKLGGKGYE